MAERKKGIVPSFLSPRELEVLEIASGELSNKRAAEKLEISFYTFNNYLTRARNKFIDAGIIKPIDKYSGNTGYRGKTTTLMIEFAAQHGWIPPIDHHRMQVLKRIHQID